MHKGYRILALAIVALVPTIVWACVKAATAVQVSAENSILSG
jgi:hypothetical protein